MSAGVGRTGTGLRLALLWVRLVSRAVPASNRADWSREWRAELRACARGRGGLATVRFALVALADARALRLVRRYPPLPSDPRRGTALMALLSDLRYAARSLRAAPGFTLAVIAVLALGIAANTTTFAFAEDLLWRVLPIRGDTPVVRLYNGYVHGFQWGSVSYPTFRELQRLDTFEAVIGEAYIPLGIEADGQADRIWGSLVTPGYFDLLAVSPQLGRFFAGSEATRPGDAPWAVISDGFWKRRYGGDPAVIGERIEINGFPLTVVGVAPGSFLGTQTGMAAEIWIPVTMQPQLIAAEDWLESRRQRQLWLLARLAPGASMTAVRAALDAQAADMAGRFPEAYESLARINALPEVEGGLHPFYRQPFARFLTLLLLVMGIVLLVACTNAAGLLLARAAARSREIAIRVAIGAGRGRIVRELLTESLLLTALAGAVGVLLAHGAIRALERLQPPTDIPLAFGFGISGRVLAYSVLVSLVTAVAFGLLPALRISRSRPADALGSRSGADAGRSHLRSALVAAQVALSLALLVGASLFLRSLENVRHIDLGYDPAGIGLGSIDLEPRGYTDAEGTELLRQLLARLRAHPEVTQAALAWSVPFGMDPNPAQVRPEDWIDASEGSLPTVEYNIVSQGYFESTGTELVRGRAFDLSDEAGTAPVMIVNERLASDFWPAQEAVGRRVHALGQAWQVVGIAENTRFRTLSGETMPYFYVPLAQEYSGEVTAYVRTRTDGSVERLLREQTAALDSSVPVFGFRTLTEQIGVAMLPARMAAAVLGFFGLLTLGLASVGLYGVLAYGVHQRRPELGLRMALGARSAQVVRLVVGESLRLVLIGLGIGLLMGAGLSRLLAGMLHDVSPNDPLSYLSTAALLLLAALVATLLPAMRATLLDPVAALRGDG